MAAVDARPRWIWIGTAAVLASSEPADIYVADAQAGTVLKAAKVDGVTSTARDRSAGGYTHLTAVLTAEPDTPAARDAITRVRDAVKGSGAVVGGQTAVALDTSRAQGDEELLLIPLILAVVLIMLVLLLRALTASLLLIASVVLSYGAALGLAGLLYRALGHP
ncbi:MMPL family transporter [Actinomadura rubrisoli]|uniref:MMPL family transporter n=1 Tax=Actinomadura rubrisoli TaxID=2530368 RepID=UPI001A9E9106|nr:MMPL family transporter [Actinomadura rubrisoli]